MRIVSLLPSATDILVALGAAEDLVGVSHSCGAEWSHVPRLTRTWIDTAASSAQIDAQVQRATQPLYQLNLEVLEKLAPDVIVSQSLCEVCAIPAGSVAEAINALPNQPLLLDLSPQRLHDIPTDFATVAEAIDRRAAAKTLHAEWDATFERHHQAYRVESPRVAFLDWIDPPFAAGHWVPDMIEWLGAASALAAPGDPSYQLAWPDVHAAQPDLVVAACCGFEEGRVEGEAAEAPLDLVLLDGYHYFSRPSPVLMASMGVLDDVLRTHLHA